MKIFNKKGNYYIDVWKREKDIQYNLAKIYYYLKEKGAKREEIEYLVSSAITSLAAFDNMFYKDKKSAMVSIKKSTFGNGIKYNPVNLR
jgi:hypothetical protein